MNNITCDIESRKWNYKDIIDFACQKYDIDGIDFKVFEDDTMLDRFSNDDFELEAMMISYNPTIYVMFVRPEESTPTIFCHELIHLWQYYRGDLVMLDGGKQYTWKGKEYTGSTEYFDRPWEKEAFKLQRKLFREYKKYLKSKK